MNQPKPMPDSFIVRGIAVTNVGVAADGFKVTALDYSPGKEVLLGGPISDQEPTPFHTRREPSKRGESIANKTGWDARLVAMVAMNGKMIILPDLEIIGKVNVAFVEKILANGI